MQVAVWNDYGGFELPVKATKKFCELKGLKWSHKAHRDIIDNTDRGDPTLLKVIEHFKGKGKRGGECLGIVLLEIPDTVSWHIEYSDMGHEWVAEDHRFWLPESGT
jgi:hypothetical protein